MNGIALIQIYCVGGALLGLWAFVRFPNRVPATAGRALVGLIVATAALGVVPGVLGYAVDRGGKPGAVAALVFVALPTITALFWSVACLFRSFAGLLKRS